METASQRLRLRCLTELLVAIASEQLGTTALKASEGFTQPLPAALALTGYILSFYFFGRSMRALPMGLAYALWSGLGMLIATATGVLLFSEALTFTTVIGVAMLITGVGILNLSTAQE